MLSTLVFVYNRLTLKTSSGMNSTVFALIADAVGSGNFSNGHRWFYGSGPALQGIPVLVVRCLCGPMSTFRKSDCGTMSLWPNIRFPVFHVDHFNLLSVKVKSPRLNHTKWLCVKQLSVYGAHRSSSYTRDHNWSVGSRRRNLDRQIDFYNCSVVQLVASLRLDLMGPGLNPGKYNFF